MSKQVAYDQGYVNLDPPQVERTVENNGNDLSNSDNASINQVYEIPIFGGHRYRGYAGCLYENYDQWSYDNQSPLGPDLPRINKVDRNYRQVINYTAIRLKLGVSLNFRDAGDANVAYANTGSDNSGRCEIFNFGTFIYVRMNFSFDKINIQSLHGSIRCFYNTANGSWYIPNNSSSSSFPGNTLLVPAVCNLYDGNIPHTNNAAEITSKKGFFSTTLAGVAQKSVASSDGNLWIGKIATHPWDSNLDGLECLHFSFQWAVNHDAQQIYFSAMLPVEDRSPMSIVQNNSSGYLLSSNGAFSYNSNTEAPGQFGRAGNYVKVNGVWVEQ